MDVDVNVNVNVDVNADADADDFPRSTRPSASASAFTSTSTSTSFCRWPWPENLLADGANERSRSPGFDRGPASRRLRGWVPEPVRRATLRSLGRRRLLISARLQAPPGQQHRLRGVLPELGAELVCF